MQAQIPFPSILLHLQRPINCLCDQDRNLRKSGLSTILTQLSSLSPTNILKLFTQTNLQQYLVKRTLWDKIQNNRELTLKIIQKFQDKMSNAQLKVDVVRPFVEELVKRINMTPFPETSQDLRLTIINLLQKLLTHFADAFAWYLPDLANAVSKTLLDPFADVKHASNSLINLLCQKFREQIGQHSINIIKSLALNLTHQHSKVRKGTLTTCGKLLITQNAGSNFQHILVSIKSCSSDKTTQVRKQVIVCSSVLLKGFGPKYMRMYQAVLVGFLLGGLSDEVDAVVQQAVNKLQQCGQAIQNMEVEQMDVQNPDISM